MKILVACEWSGTVGHAFAKKKHEVYTCDLLPSEKINFAPFLQHIKGDVLEVLDEDWDLMIAHPPCTYLCVSGIHWNKGNVERQKKTEEAFEFFMKLWEAPIEKVCIENPVGVISSLFRPPDQYIQPYEFGHDASKKTGLWLRGLPTLQPTSLVAPSRYHKGRPRWANQCDSGADRLGPSPDRGKIRGKTYEGIAEAMAEQWS